jgi:catecholate siderophore receptor
MQLARLHTERNTIDKEGRCLPGTARRGTLVPVVQALSVIVSGVGLLAGSCQAATTNTVEMLRDGAVPAGPLGPALRSFASTANILLVFTEQQVNGRNTAGLPGPAGVDEALAILLAGTGLRAVRLDKGSFVLREAPRRSAVSRYDPMPVVTITGAAASTNVLMAAPRAARMAGPVQDIPQAVNVVARDLLEQQQVTTLEQALRNVPGITASIGEADGGPNGDQFKIRGLDATTDSYSDGLHDFGVYVRDTFNTEQVEVFKGPSSENFGIGASGGAINSETRLASLSDGAAVEAKAGQGPTRRVTADFNRRLGAADAVRVNLMRHTQQLADRDGVRSDRWGIAVSLGFGLGTDSSWYLNAVHQSNDRTPDYGQPMFARTSGGIRSPVAEFGVPRNYYYGKDTDRDRSNANILTSLFKQRIAGGFTVSNDTRLGHHERSYSATTPSCFSTDGACNQSGAAAFLAGGDPAIVYSGSGGAAYFQRDVGLQSVSTLRGNVAAGGLKHEVAVGLDVSHQRDEVFHFANRTLDGRAEARKSAGTLWHPDTSSGNYLTAVNPAATDNLRELTRTDLAVFASDRVQFAPAWSLLGYVRYDQYRQKYRLKGSADPIGKLAENTPRFASPKASLIWTPDERQDYYLSWGWGSALANGGNITVNNTSDTAQALARQLDPQKTRIVELGGKLSLLEKRLGLSASLFRMTKENASSSDGMGGFVPADYRQRIAGLEVGISGQPLRHWSVYAGYGYLDSRILDAPADFRTQIGNPVQGTPKKTASLWTTLDLAGAGPGQLQVGAGLSYRDRMAIRNDLLAEVPHSFSADLMLSWRCRNVRLTANVYNLGNHINYDTFFAGKTANSARATPSAGRSILLSVRKDF